MKTLLAADRSRAIAVIVLLLAALRVTTAVTMPPLGESGNPDQLAGSTILLVVQAALFLFSPQFRTRSGAVPYFGIQTILIMGIGMFSLSLWLVIALVAALIVQGVTPLRARA